MGNGCLSIWLAGQWLRFSSWSVFHFQDDRMIPQTCQRAFALMTEKLGRNEDEFRPRYLENYRAARDGLREFLPQMGEGRDRFKPPVWSHLRLQDGIESGHASWGGREMTRADVIAGTIVTAAVSVPLYLLAAGLIREMGPLFGLSTIALLLGVTALAVTPPVFWAGFNPGRTRWVLRDKPFWMLVCIETGLVAGILFFMFGMAVMRAGATDVAWGWLSTAAAWPVVMGVLGWRVGRNES